MKKYVESFSSGERSLALRDFNSCLLVVTYSTFFQLRQRIYLSEWYWKRFV